MALSFGLLAVVLVMGRAFWWFEAPRIGWCLAVSALALGSAVARTLFLPPSMLTGLGAALKRGPEYITSFFVVFLFTQSIGGLMGSAFFTTFVVLRERYHRAISSSG